MRDEAYHPPAPIPPVLQFVLALIGAASLYTGFTLPPRAARLDPPSAGTTVYGGYHLHSNRSDGTGTPDEIAAAAARAGLQFIILTDHGDATRRPDAPAYRHGVLCIDGVEINTDAGHLVALGLDKSAPYPLAGEARDVIDDIHRLGGWAILAHPDSPKDELRWRSWNVNYDGIEWLNADSEWRDESALHLLGTLARYLVRSPESIASLYKRPSRTLQRWDGAARLRPVVGLAGLDSHARLALSDNDTTRSSHALLARPSYVEMFRTIAQAVTLDRPLTGTAAADAATLMTALHEGRTFSVISAIAAPGQLTFTTRGHEPSAGMGESVEFTGEAPSLSAKVVGVPDARVVLLRNGSAFRSGAGMLDVSGAILTAGEYRVEVYYPGREMPWMVSNPIYLRQPGMEPSATAVLPTPAPPSRIVDLPGDDGWNVARDLLSTGQATREARTVALSFGLGAAPPAGQYAAVVTSLNQELSQEGFDRVAFSARADRPMRISVQLRLPGDREGQRWRRSVYVDQTPREIVLSLQDFTPVEPTTQRPIVAHIKTVLFVVDTVNTPPGSKGTIWLSDVRLGVGST